MSDDFYAKLAGERLDEVIRLRAENENLRAALKPFADEASYYEGRGKHLDIGNMGQLTVADLRAARAVYLGEKE